MIAPIDDPRLANFVAQLDTVNQLADNSSGFVWRLQTDGGNSTGIRIEADASILVNMSVWASIETLYEFSYKTTHVGLLRDRERWFEKSDIPALALWWVSAGTVPSVDEGIQLREHLRQHGPSDHAFTFKKRHPVPSYSRERGLRRLVSVPIHGTSTNFPNTFPATRS